MSLHVVRIFSLFSLFLCVFVLLQLRPCFVDATGHFAGTTRDHIITNLFTRRLPALSRVSLSLLLLPLWPTELYFSSHYALRRSTFNRRVLAGSASLRFVDRPLRLLKNECYTILHRTRSSVIIRHLQLSTSQWSIEKRSLPSFHASRFAKDRDIVTRKI